MCIAIPMQVIEARGLCAQCLRSGRPVPVSTELTGPASPGDWLLVFRSLAIRRLGEAEARESLRLLLALAQAMADEAGFPEKGGAPCLPG